MTTLQRRTHPPVVLEQVLQTAKDDAGPPSAGNASPRATLIEYEESTSAGCDDVGQERGQCDGAVCVCECV